MMTTTQQERNEMTTTTQQDSLSAQTENPLLASIWLEITGVCNLECVHCYAESGPAGPRDRVGTRRWVELLHEAAALGVRVVQFIGGEPLLHPDITQLLVEANTLGIDVEIFSNLTHVRESLWSTFKELRVSLATSFYSYNSNVHDQITQQVGSWTRTVTNIKRAVECGLPLRVGIIDIRADQDIQQTTSYLQSLGVSSISIDRSRGIGRGAKDASASCSTEELCGACTTSRLAIREDGQANPCVFARWLNVGDVRDMSLSAVVHSVELARARQLLDAAFVDRPQMPGGPCSPDNCNPNCTPGCTPTCAPACTPLGGCLPGGF